MRTCRNTAITLKRNSLNISPGGERFTDCKFHSIQSTCCELRRVLMCETACGLILNFTASSLPERVLLRISRTISAFKWVDHCLSPRRPILTALAMFSTSTLAQDTHHKRPFTLQCFISRTQILLDLIKINEYIKFRNFRDKLTSVPTFGTDLVEQDNPITR